jgi:glycerol-3-phosphate acyltransferase PlsY
MCAVIPHYIGVALAAYLIGSVPTGYLMGRARGVDIRKVGSGNIGATNVMRTLGKPIGIAVLLADALKGALPVALLPGLAARLGPGMGSGTGEGLALCAALGAVLGHNYTCWLRFKGGKGIATSAGALLVLMPKALGLTVLLWAVVMGFGRWVSLASVVAATALPFIVWGTGGSRTLIAAAAVLGAMAVYKHRANLQRLRAGTEPKFGRSAASNPTST